MIVDGRILRQQGGFTTIHGLRFVQEAAASVRRIQDLGFLNINRKEQK